MKLRKKMVARNSSFRASLLEFLYVEFTPIHTHTVSHDAIPVAAGINVNTTNYPIDLP